MNCAGIALTNNGRVFLIRPFYGGNAQSFAIPKGHVNDGESFRDAAVREFFEETGIDLRGRDMRELTCVYTKIGNGRVKRVVVFKVNGDGDERFSKTVERGVEGMEATFGEYVPFQIARDFITGYQIPVIDSLMDDDLSSLVNFYVRRQNND